jgi:hypothetical protein
VSTLRTQKITTAADTEIVTSATYPNMSMMTIANTTGAAITVDLYLEADILGEEFVNTDFIENTTSEVNQSVAPEGYAVTGASEAIAITNTGTAATSDVFLNKGVYKSDGTLFGICTAFGSATFGGGVVNTMADDDDLYVASKNYIIRNVIIPNAEWCFFKTRR